MIITVFRSRLRPGVRDDYGTLANRMNEIAMTMPGYISHKGFFADDGERVTVVEFEHEEGMRAWRMNPEHRAAQKVVERRGQRSERQAYTGRDHAHFLEHPLHRDRVRFHEQMPMQTEQLVVQRSRPRQVAAKSGGAHFVPSAPAAAGPW